MNLEEVSPGINPENPQNGQPEVNPVEAARQLILRDQYERQQAFRKALEALVQQYKCDLEVDMVREGGLFRPVIRIQPY